ncbi:MAG: NADH-quinone oxidoreductase subunit NuoH [Chitinophagaceae bacterium]
MFTVQFYITLLFILFIIIFALVVAMYATYMERKVAGMFQDRLGPNRAGPFGIFQPLCDGVKLFLKEEIIPTHANKFLFILGPALAMIMAMITTAVIPWSTSLQIGEYTVPLQVTDINVALLYIFAVLSVNVYGVMIGGWASNNKYSRMSALRVASQMISYELAMGFAIIALIMATGTFSLKEIVLQQQAGNWNVLIQPLGFILFLICSFAECNRAPFDLAEAENELIGGYHSEYSSMKLGFYLFAEYINMFTASMIMSTLYFGGYDIPFFDESTSTLGTNTIAILGFLSLFSKALFFMFVFMWVRWTLPRFRFDQLMRLGWKGLIPLGLINMLITGIILLLLKK